MVTTKAVITWLAILQTQQLCEAFSIQTSASTTARTTAPRTRTRTRNTIRYATKGFGSSSSNSSPAVDKERQKSINGLEDWAKAAGIL